MISFYGTRFSPSPVPLFFLFWMVPNPEFILNPIVGCCRRVRSRLRALSFRSSAFPQLKSGNTNDDSGLTIEVAQECSSIRSSLMLVVTTMVLAQMLCAPVWRKKPW